ncbi:MAG: peptidase dimerization domain-containing protein [Paludibaculum sp.]
MIARTENSPRRLMEVLNQPSFNIRGIDSGAVGEASRNVIPSEAATSVDIRLVKGNDPRAMLEKVKAHIRDQGYFLLEDREPTEIERLQWPKVAAFYTSEPGYRAVRTSMDLPQSRAVIAALEATGRPLVKMPTLGGSVPLAIIEDVLHIPLIGVPIANHDNNQHSHNENLRLQNLWDGIETMRSLSCSRPTNTGKADALVRSRSPDRLQSPTTQTPHPSPISPNPRDGGRPRPQPVPRPAPKPNNANAPSLINQPQPSGRRTPSSAAGPLTGSKAQQRKRPIPHQSAPTLGTADALVRSRSPDRLQSPTTQTPHPSSISPNPRDGGRPRPQPVP